MGLKQHYVQTLIFILFADCYWNWEKNRGVSNGLSPHSPTFVSIVFLHYRAAQYWPHVPVLPNMVRQPLCWLHTRQVSIAIELFIIKQITSTKYILNTRVTLSLKTLELSRLLLDKGKLRWILWILRCWTLISLKGFCECNTDDTMFCIVIFSEKPFHFFFLGGGLILSILLVYLLILTH